MKWLFLVFSLLLLYPSLVSAKFLDDPISCTSWGPNRIDCFVRGTTKAMFHQRWNGAVWSGWENLGGTLDSDIDCVTWGPGRIDCFAMGTNKALYHKWLNGLQWYGWENLGGTLLGAPSCVARGPNLLDCFINQDKALYTRWWNGSNWSQWANLGILDEAHPNRADWKFGIDDVGPTCISGALNSIDCFITGGANLRCGFPHATACRWYNMFQKSWNGGPWESWKFYGGLIKLDIGGIANFSWDFGDDGGPTDSNHHCVASGSRRVDCFKWYITGLFHLKFPNSGREGPAQAEWKKIVNAENFDGLDNTKPSCISYGVNDLDCFFIYKQKDSNSGELRFISLTDSGWSGVIPLGGDLMRRPPKCISLPSTSYTPARVDCFAVGTDKTLKHIFFKNGGVWSNWESLGGVIFGKD